MTTTTRRTASAAPRHPVTICTTAAMGLLVAAGCLAPDETRDSSCAERDVVVCPDGDVTFGIDVSYWQGNIDWNDVASDGVEFAFIRVSDGLSYYDTEFQDNWADAHATGVIRGAYQFFRPGEDPVAQAQLLINEIGTLQTGDLPPVIDVETDDGYSQSHVTNAIHQWIDEVEAAFGVQPIIYTGYYTWLDDVGSNDFAGYPLWIAQYGVSCPDLPTPWTDWVFWQDSSSGYVDGISGNVDTDWFNGDVADLEAYTVGEATCGDGICSGGETHETCPEDCPGCDPIPPAGRAVDETELCFDPRGNDAYWYTASDGYQGSLRWTHTTDSATVDNHAYWDLDFEEAGTYLVEVYTDGDWAESRQARYVVRHNGHEAEVVVDQAAVDGWNPLEEMAFAAGGDQWIRLDDNTGEPYNGGETQIVFDAVRLTRVGDDDDDDDDTAAGDDDTAAGDDDTAAGDDDDGHDDDWYTADPEDDGCSCRTAPEGRAAVRGAATPPLVLLSLVVAWAARRRGRVTGR